MMTSELPDYTGRICPDSADVPSFQAAVNFLTEYSAWLLGCGATCIRLEKNVGRMAASLGIQVETTIMPRHIHMSFYDRRADLWVSTVTAPHRMPISFSVNTRLSRLSWQIADGEIPFSRAREALEAAIVPERQNIWLLILLVTLANASFCRLFGGDGVAMGVVAAATAAGYLLKTELLRRGCDVRVMMFFCALVSSVLGATGILFSVGDTPAIALGTSVLYLVPGIPFLNSFSDMIYRHYICAFSRLTDAVVLTCCLSAGLCAGMALMHTGMF